jgi:hypothetical protein
MEKDKYTITAWQLSIGYETRISIKYIHRPGRDKDEQVGRYLIYIFLPTAGGYS